MTSECVVVGKQSGAMMELFGAMIKKCAAQGLRRLVGVIVVGLLSSGPMGEQETAADWPQFRGSDSRGLGDDANLPETWSATENVAWKTDLPGRGWSSPIVVGDRVFVTTVVNRGESEEPKKGLYFGGDRPTPPESVHEWRVICLDLKSGTILWNQKVHEGTPPSSIHLKNSFASETPVSDGKQVYAYFGNLGLYCFSLDGELRWQKDFPAHATRLGWGTASSPAIHGDRIFVVDDNEEESQLLALDTQTGEVVWRVPRDEKSNWSTPYVWQNGKRTELVTLGSQQVRSYDLDGNLLWSLRGMSSITIATPYAYQDLLIISSGYILDPLKPIYAIRPGAEGDISLPENATSNEWIAWSNREAAPYNPTTLVTSDRLYVLLDRGFLTCYRAATGEPVFDRQRIPKGGMYTASPWAYGDKLYCINEDGVTHVFQVGDEFRWLHANELAEDDMTLATPAIAGDRLLLRTAARLYCIRKSP